MVWKIWKQGLVCHQFFLIAFCLFFPIEYGWMFAFANYCNYPSPFYSRLRRTWTPFVCRNFIPLSTRKPDAWHRRLPPFTPRTLLSLTLNPRLDDRLLNLILICRIPINSTQTPLTGEVLSYSNNPEMLCDSSIVTVSSTGCLIL